MNRYRTRHPLNVSREDVTIIIIYYHYHILYYYNTKLFFFNLFLLSKYKQISIVRQLNCKIFCFGPLIIWKNGSSIIIN